MAVTKQVTLTPELVTRAAQHIRSAMSTGGDQSAALCALNGQCLWASSPSFEAAAPNIAKIGIMSLKLWVRVRRGKLDRIGLVTDDGVVDIVFVPPIASVLVVSRSENESDWLEQEPLRLLGALDLA